MKILLAAISALLVFGATPQAATQPPNQPPAHLLAGFETGVAPFSGSGPGAAELSDEHATEGKHSLKLSGGYAVWDGAEDWSGYDFFKADTFNSGAKPIQIYIEIQDTATTGYWTRVN